MEWLFHTCHNYWIVCRLVRDDDRPFLAYLPKISIKDSSEPFRAFLGTILSVLKGAYIEPSTFNLDLQLDAIIEDTDESHLPEDDIDDRPGAYPGISSKGGTTEPQMTRYRSCAGHDNAEPVLMVCPLAVICCVADSPTLRLLPRPPAHLSPSKYGFISKPCRTTRSPFRCLTGMGNAACG
jgi:hypothetical protein